MQEVEVLIGNDGFPVVVAKSWNEATGRINIGTGWTLISVECYYNKCDNCIYDEFCKKTKTKIHKIPILKRVVRELIIKYGKPPQNLIDKFEDLPKRGKKCNDTIK